MGGTRWVNFPFSTPGSETLRWTEGIALTGYIHHPVLPRKAPPSGYRPIWVRREKIIRGCEGRHTCADRIPDTSRTNVRHLLAWAGSRVVVSKRCQSFAWVWFREMLRRLR